MLVIGRSVGEVVYLDVPACPNGCCPARRLGVHVNRVQGRAVRLALDCPHDVVILRPEVSARKEEGRS